MAAASASLSRRRASSTSSPVSTARSDVLKKSGKNYTIDVIASGAAVNNEISSVKSYYLGHQDEPCARHVRRRRRHDGRHRRVHGAVRPRREGRARRRLPTSLPRTLQLIQQGAMDFTIDQQPYLQGYYTVMQAYMYLLSGGLSGPADTNTGLKFVTKDNVGSLSRDADPVRGLVVHGPGREALAARSRADPDMRGFLDLFRRKREASILLVAVILAIYFEAMNSKLPVEQRLAREPVAIHRPVASITPAAR